MGRSLWPSAPPPPSPPAAAASAPDDAALIVAARADPQAFGALYQRYVGLIYRYCDVQLGNRAAAEDATSEVFLKALANLHKFRDGSVAAWLFRIAHNTVVDVHRRPRTASIEDAGDPVDPGAAPEVTVLAGAQRAALRAALAELPDDQRAAVVLQMAGWSGEQIAAALKKSPAAVYMLRSRALQRLAKSLRRHGWCDSNA